jgi:hypothetical protein
MDRASDSGSEGWGFESLRARQILPRRRFAAPLFFRPLSSIVLSTYYTPKFFNVCSN